MFNLFNKKKYVATDTKLNVTTDFHSHILPGLDDGAPDIEASLLLVKGLRSIGYKKLIASPHVIGDMYRNTPEKILAALDVLQVACKEHGIDIELAAAAEYMLDDYFLDMLRSGKKLLTVDKNLLLTELSYATPTDNLHEIAFELLTQNYQPILAHPERYFYYHRNLAFYDTLKEYGFLMQVNLLSLTCYYGPGVMKVARYLFEKGMVDFVGTDMHHERHLGMLSKPENMAMLNGFMEGKNYNVFD